MAIIKKQYWIDDTLQIRFNIKVDSWGSKEDFAKIVSEERERIAKKGDCDSPDYEPMGLVFIDVDTEDEFVFHCVNGWNDSRERNSYFYFDNKKMPTDKYFEYINPFFDPDYEGVGMKFVRARERLDFLEYRMGQIRKAKETIKERMPWDDILDELEAISEMDDQECENIEKELNQ